VVKGLAAAFAQGLAPNPPSPGLKRVRTEMERMSPEGLLRTWVIEGPQNAEKLWKSLANVMTGAIGPKPDEPK
jgi:hypothetical protein